MLKCLDAEHSLIFLDEEMDVPELTMSSERLKQFEMKRDYCQSGRIYLAFYSWGVSLFQVYSEVRRSAKNWRTKIMVRSASCKGVRSLATNLFNFSLISLRRFFFCLFFVFYFFVLFCFFFCGARPSQLNEWGALKNSKLLRGRLALCHKNGTQKDWTLTLYSGAQWVMGSCYTLI